MKKRSYQWLQEKLRRPQLWLGTVLLTLLLLSPATREQAQAALLRLHTQPHGWQQSLAAQKPVADFASNLTAGEAPLRVSFADRSTGQPTAWQWDFGDGATATEQNPSHLYQTPGGYQVTLTVSNGAGLDSLTRATYIIVNAPPVIDPPLPADPASTFEDPIVTAPAGAGAASGSLGATTTLEALGDPNAPVLQSPANGATAVSTPNSTLQSCVADPDGDNLTVTFYGRELSPLAAPNFTIVAVPDTQFYYNADATTAPTFLAQMQWIVNNRASRNIAFVSHLGDVVNDGSVPGAGKASAQWKTADGVMKTIEDQTLTTLLDGIPYGVAVGNHDQGPSFGDPTKTQLFNQYFGVSRFAGRGYYGGHLGNDNDNSYQLFSVGDLKFIAVHLEFDVSNRPATFTWVDNLLNTYADRWAIVSAHEILLHDATWRPQGLKIWNGVKDHPNLLLMLAGHISGESRRQDVAYHGNTVNTFLSDYQSRANGGDGWLRYMEFMGAQSKVTVYTYSVTRNQYEQDANSFFQVALDTPADAPLRRPFQIIAQQSNVASGSCPTALWSGLAPDRQYEWYVGVSDSPTDPADVQSFSNRATFSTGSGSGANTINFNNLTYLVNENGGAATITVNLNRTTTQVVTVNYATSNGTADGSDYTTTSGVLTFAADETSKSFPVPISDDTVDENDETILLTLSGASNAVLGSLNTATITIVDNDPAAAGTPTHTPTSTPTPPTTGTPTTTPTSTATGSATSTATATTSATPLATATTTATASDTPSPTASVTATPMPTATATPTAPAVATATVTPTATATTTAALRVAFSQNLYVITPATTAAEITVIINAPPPSPVTVTYIGTLSSQGTTNLSVNNPVINGTLTFTPDGPLSQSFTVPIEPTWRTAAETTIDLDLVATTAEEPAGQTSSAVMLILPSRIYLPLIQQSQ